MKYVLSILLVVLSSASMAFDWSDPVVASKVSELAEAHYMYNEFNNSCRAIVFTKQGKILFDQKKSNCSIEEFLATRSEELSKLATYL